MKRPFEIELFLVEDGRERNELVYSEATCPTERMNIATNLARSRRAAHFNFGPVIERNEDGQIELSGRAKR